MREPIPSLKRVIEYFSRMSDFYDRMASLYHLIFQDWNASIERQAGQLVSIIEVRWGPGCRAAEKTL